MKGTRILAVDIGNTSTVCALCTNGRVGKINRLPSVGHKPGVIARFLRDITENREITGSALCSVVPDLTGLWKKELTSFTESRPLVVTHNIKLGIGIDYPHPENIGPDRLANAAAAAKYFGTPAIILDFGTAVTIDTVSRKGAYAGGVIMPGLRLMSEYFNERTALLPRLDFFRKHHGKIPAIGKSTEQAMYIGALTGFHGMIKEVVARIKKELGPGRIHMCATGGNAAVILQNSNLNFQTDPKLTIKGLYAIYALNRLI